MQTKVLILSDNLLVLTVRILKTRTDKQDTFLYSYDYVFVDEFRDTTKASICTYPTAVPNTYMPVYFRQ